MEKDYSNYDLLDRLIANEKKARSWTVFWITLLCILAVLLIVMSVWISQKNRQINEQLDTIKTQYAILESQRDTISDKNALIKSLEEDCNRDKTRMSDSFKVEVTKAITSITKLDEQTAGNHGQATNTEIASARESTIKKLDTRIMEISKVFQQDKPRLFIQYNLPSDLPQISNLLANLKANNDFVVPPPELVRSKFSYLIKCYNYTNPQQEERIRNLTARFLSLKPDDFRISHETKAGMHPTMEIWLGSPNFIAPQKATLLIQQKS